MAETSDQMSEEGMSAGFGFVERRCADFGTDSSHRSRGMLRYGENPDAVTIEHISADHISPELALVDPELAAHARAALADPAPPPARTARAPQPPAPTGSHRPYPFWARVTAALWLLVLGILIGGAAIPHAQDTPRVVPSEEDPTFCPAPDQLPGDLPGPGG